MTITEHRQLGQPVAVYDNEGFPETVWTEKVALLDRIPRPIAMIGILALFLLFWQGLHSFGIVSPIILPSTAVVGAVFIFVGQNLLFGGYMLAALLVMPTEVI